MPAHVGVLVGRWAVNAGESNVNDIGTVPTIALTVTTMGRLVPTPAVAVQNRAVVDTHWVEEQAIEPIDPVGVSKVEPKLSPCNVVGTPPLVPPLNGYTKLTVGASNV